MVAITVILAAVIGTFVLGLGDQVSDSSPQASFTFDLTDSGSNTNGATLANTAANDGDLDITHDGGDTIDSSKLKITDGTADVTSFSGFGSEVSAGSTETVTIDADDTIRVVFEASNGDSTSTLGKFEGPEA